MSLRPLNDKPSDSPFLLWPVGEFDHNDREDVLLSKKFLKQAGYLDEPQKGFSVYFDAQADKALRAFQKQNGLDPDGRMTPEGPSFPKLAAVAAKPTQSPNSDKAGKKARSPVADAQKHYDTRGPLGPDGRPMPPDPGDFRFNESGAVAAEAMDDDDDEINATLMWTLANTGINPKTGEFDYYGNIDGFERDSRTGRWRKLPDDVRKPESPAESKKAQVISPPPAPPIFGKRKGKQIDLEEWKRWAVEMGLWIGKFADDDDKPDSMRR